MDFVDYLLKFIGRPYIWAGDGTQQYFEGFDCSGIVLEGLWAFGIYNGNDTNSQGLKNWCVSNGWSNILQKNLQRGDLVFFGKQGISHVAVALGDGLMLEAGGGSSTCVSLQTSTGFVRIRPVSRRKDFLCAYRQPK